jgi:hypothetical protein
MLRALIFVDLPSLGFGEWIPGAPSDGLSVEDDTEAGAAARFRSAATATARANPGCPLQLPGGNRPSAQDRYRNCCQECVLDDLLTHDRSPFIALISIGNRMSFLLIFILLSASGRGRKASSSES